MDPEELMSKLGLTSPSSKKIDIKEITNGEGKRQKAPEGQKIFDSVTHLDQWDIARGTEILETSTTLRSKSLDEIAVADFYACYFQMDPQIHKLCLDPLRKKFIKELLDNVDYQALHDITSLNHFPSTMACKKAAQEFADFKNKQKNKPQPKNQRQKEKAELQKDMELLKAVDKALRETTEQVEEMQDCLASIGCGIGENESSMNPDEILQTYQEIQNNDVIKAICDSAGKFRMYARGKQRNKTQHGYEDMVGIKLDDTIEYLLSEELATLLDDDLELDTLRRLVEKETLAFEYKGTEKVGKGPIVICVDGSGSMRGNKIIDAKAFALSMAWIAQKQNRTCILVSFSSGRKYSMCVLKPNKWNQKQLLEWLGHFFGGGTTMHVPLEEVPFTIWKQLGIERKNSDIICITDALVGIHSEMSFNFNKWKEKEKVRMIGLVIGDSTESIECVCNEVHSISSISTNEKGIQQCLSI